MENLTLPSVYMQLCPLQSCTAITSRERELLAFLRRKAMQNYTELQHLSTENLRLQAERRHLSHQLVLLKLARRPTKRASHADRQLSLMAWAGVASRSIDTTAG